MRDLVSLADISRTTGLATGTLRFYRWAGLLPPPRKRVGNINLYARSDVRRFIAEHKRGFHPKMIVAARKRQRV